MATRRIWQYSCKTGWDCQLERLECTAEWTLAIMRARHCWLRKGFGRQIQVL